MMTSLSSPKFVFNTYSPEAAAALFYAQGLGAIGDITFGDFDNYQDYDIAFFPTYEKDLREMQRAKSVNPKLKTVILDPRGSQVEPYLSSTDLLVVDSVEMQDFFAKYQKPIYTYYEYPDVPLIEKQHSDKEKIVIGYHGNKVHLTAMYPEITSAIELLGEKYDIEFWALYNVSQLGVWDVGVPKNVKVHHIQWSMDAYAKYLSKVDIGVAPACMPLKPSTRRRSVVSRFFLDSKDDYVIKFKMPSNPGRLIVFAKLGIPVVADFLPSNLQFIKDSENGLLAKSTGGWYRALEQLIQSAALRQQMADAMRDTYDQYFDYAEQNRKFSAFLQEDFAPAPALKDILRPRHDFWEDRKFQNAFVRERVKKLKGKFL
jgi:glycosyltransferase involved in cell wall biosynthesis